MHTSEITRTAEPSPLLFLTGLVSQLKTNNTEKPAARRKNKIA